MIPPHARMLIAPKGYYKQVPNGRLRQPGCRYHRSVQRLFSMFPAGLPGAALFLFRLAVAGIVLVTVLDSEPIDSLDLWKAVSVLVVTVLLWLGALTPMASGISIAIEVIYWPTSSGLRGAEQVFHIVLSLALFFLGPGAYSIDARMFGRRLILPPSQ